jgi:5'-methylthioadenosine phosphorylase
MERIGIIGGTGLVNFNFKDGPTGQYHMSEKRTDNVIVQTEYGEVPLKCMTINIIGNDEDKELFFLQRHHNEGQANKPPHSINHKANMAALKEACCDVVISVCSVGTLEADFPPGKVALADQYIDFTGIASTFSEEFATFTSVTEPFSAELNKKLELELRLSQGFSDSEERMYYTYWLAQGPHFETRAEVDAIGLLGGHMVGMTMAREVKLANELNIPYSAICISSNWAAGREPGDPSAALSHQQVSSQANERLEPVFQTIFSILRHE